MQLLTYSDYTLDGLNHNIGNFLTVLTGILLLIGVVYIIKKLKELW